ncbi:MAG: stage III sporulation protein AE [Clostridia bacterium]
MNTKRNAIIAILLCALLLPSVAGAQTDLANEVKDELDSQLAKQDLSSWQTFFGELSPEVRQIWGYESITDMMGGYINGEVDTQYESKLNALVGLLLASIKRNMAALGMVFAIALISGIIGVLLDDDKQDIKAITSFVCFGMYVVVISYLVASLVNTANEAITRLSGFTEVATPVIATMLAATGNVSAGGIVRPLTVFMSQTVTGFFKTVIMPLILSGAVIAVTGNLTGKSKLTHLYGSIKTIIKWLIGMVFTVFLGLVSIQGISVSGMDSISIRTIKYTLDKTLPVVGSAVSGTFDTARGCAVLVKNAAGITAMLVGIGCILLPLLQIAGTSLALKLSAAVCEPIADERMSGMIDKVADICSYLMAAVIVIGLMFLIMLGLFIATGSMAV